LPGISENIEVISIIGRFLEHSRIYYFHNGGDEEVYLGSADLMPRNLDHRVEILFPLADEKLVGRVRDEFLKCYLSDTQNGRRMLSDGTFVRKKAANGKPAVNCQESWIPKRRSVESHESAETLTLKHRPDD
jgi:polyphosphate kinase